MPNNDIMIIKEIKDYLKITGKTTYRFASKGKLLAFKASGFDVLEKSEINTWIIKQEQQK